MSALRQTPLYRALHRENLIWGGDRKLMLSALCLAGILVFSAMNTVGFISGTLFGSVSVYCLRRMAKADPLMREVYFRQIKYLGYYAPFSRPSRISKNRRVY